MSAEKKRVLVTGARGAVGTAASIELRRRGHFVRGFGRNAMENVDEACVGDLADRAAVSAASEGVDAVVHLAATPDVSDFMTELLQPNIVGVYNVMEAAREHGVKRVVFASTVQTVMGFQKFADQELIRPEDGTAPRNHYSVSKVFGEAMCEMYAHEYGISTIPVRVGWLPREQHHVDSLSKSEWGQNVYLSPGDTGRFFACCVEAGELPPVTTLFVTSIPKTRTILDLEPSKRWVGYEPQETWPEGCPHPLPQTIPEE